MTAYRPTQPTIARITDRTARRIHAPGRQRRGGGDLVLRRVVAFLLVAFFAMVSSGTRPATGQEHAELVEAYSAAARLEITSAFSCSIRREMARSRRLANRFFNRATRAFW